MVRAQDTFKGKINVGVGAYRDESGKPVVLPSVREAQRRLLDKGLDMEYAGIAGIPEFVTHALKLSLGESSEAIASNRIAAVQSLSGTGAVRLAAEFANRFLGKGSTMYIPNQTWGNHLAICKDAGLEVKRYRYYDPKTCGLDIEGLLEDLSSLPERSLVLMHACAHNPTGVDPSKAQWGEVKDVFLDRGHVALFDSAYQGFASGDTDADAFALRLFADSRVPMMICQSFAKNFGLYGQRVGTFSILCESSDEAERVLSQLKILVRPMYSSPPIEGARIVAEILSDPALKAQWMKDCKGMADRIKHARDCLRSAVEATGAPGEWSHITSQIGMFCFSGLSPEECDAMVDEHHIYLTRDGRISMAGVTEANAPIIAKAIHQVTTKARS
jgi:aspartate aminotransferase, mitochondrial